MIGGNGIGNFLQKHGFAGTGRSHDKAALALTDGGGQIHHPHGKVARFRFQNNSTFRIERREVIEKGFIPSHRRIFKIDFGDLEQREISLPLLGRTNLTGHGIPGA